MHGSCSSSGCYAVTDECVKEIFALGHEAFKGEQIHFQITAYPFRMTPANIARYKDDPNCAFRHNLNGGYGIFELTKAPLKEGHVVRKALRLQPSSRARPDAVTGRSLSAYR